MEKTLIISLKDRAITAQDGFRYSLTKRFFNLYALLALERIKPKTDSAGFVDVGYISSLPYWEKNADLSIGKQISRHINEMKKVGRNVIEYIQKVKGPFRLSLAPRQILIEENINSLRSFLGLNHLLFLSMQDTEETFYSFVQKIWRGDIAFNEGDLNEAMIQFGDAANESINAENKISTMHRIGRVFERMGEYRKANDTYKRVHKTIKAKSPLNNILLAENYVYHGWLYVRWRKLEKARRKYYRALDLIRGKGYYRLLGEVYNGFGKLSEIEEEYNKALSFYQQALSCWVSVSYFYGIQACYFNIGNLYKIWADKDLILLKSRLSDYAQDKYRNAIKWSRDCIKFCDRTGLGDDSSQDRNLVSYCYFRLQDYDQSLSYALEALEIAEDSRNIQDLAASCKRVAAAYWKKEDIEKAKKYIKDSIFYYNKLDDTKEVQKIKDQLKELNL